MLQVFPLSSMLRFHIHTTSVSSSITYFIFHITMILDFTSFMFVANAFRKGKKKGCEDIFVCQHFSTCNLPLLCAY
jgi:hypothetical protein